MRRYGESDAVDLLIVGAGAGGSVLAQRLARAGWRIVILEAGPFWHPGEDWVSDEAGSHALYWTQKRIIGGEDPIELGKNNSGRGVGGSMVHYAGYCPRFHPSDFQTYTLDGVGADWPIGYDDIRRHYERVEAELPVAGQNWPWGHPHRYPPPAAEFGQRPLPERVGQQRRPGRALRDGAGSHPVGGPVARRGADVQGAAAGGVVGAVLRNRPVPGICPRLFHPDRVTAADRLGGTRARRRALGPRPARVHARLQPLGYRR